MKNKNFGRKRQAIYILSNRKSTRIIKTLMDFFFFIKVKIKMVYFSVPSSLGCGMNCKIRVTSAVAERIASPTDMRLIPAGRNIGIQPLYKGYRLRIKQYSPTLFFYLILSSIILFMYESAIDERRIIFVLYEFITINVRRNKKNVGEK